MSKLTKRGDEARKALEAGVDTLADTVKVTLEDVEYVVVRQHDILAIVD